MDNANNPQMPPQQNIPSSAPPKPRPKSSILFTIIAVIVVIIVVVAVAIIILPSSSSSTHFAFVPVNKVENLTGTTLTQYTFTYSKASTNGVIKSEVAYYNSTSGGHIMIGIIQFTNTTECSNFYNTELKTISSFNNTFSSFNVTMANCIFNGFNYVYIYKSIISNYLGESFGHSGQYFFMIVDENIPVSNFNALVQDQITAMS